MALYLDEQTRPYLKKLLKDVKENDWIGQRLQKMVEADTMRLSDISECDHIPTEYIGKKTCCGKCGSFFQTGMGEEWVKSNL